MPSSVTDLLRKTRGKFLIYVIYVIQENIASRTKEKKYLDQERLYGVKNDCRIKIRLGAVYFSLDAAENQSTKQKIKFFKFPEFRGKE